jgi:hypothetical protein
MVVYYFDEAEIIRGDKVLRGGPLIRRDGAYVYFCPGTVGVGF